MTIRRLRGKTKLSDLRQADRTVTKYQEKILRRCDFTFRKGARKKLLPGHPAWWYVRRHKVHVLVLVMPGRNHFERFMVTHQGNTYRMHKNLMVQCRGFPTPEDWEQIKQEYLVKMRRNKLLRKRRCE